MVTSIVNFGVCLILTGVHEVTEPSHTSTANGYLPTYPASILEPLFNMYTASNMSVITYLLRAIPGIHEINALIEVL